MARMRRIQIVIDPELDDRLEREADARGLSKSALVRDCLERGLELERYDNGLATIAEELSPLFAEVEPGDIDTELYGPLEAPS
jgi:predicted transcriptional regulator